MTTLSISSRIRWFPAFLLLAGAGFLRCAVGAAEPEAAPAGLRWDATERTMDLEWNAKTAKALFHVTNTTSGPLRLIANSDCGCLTSLPDPNPLPAGTSGTLEATLQVGFRSGTVTKTVTVTTDPPGASPVVLRFTAHIPVLATIRPGFLHWQTGESSATKTAKVTLQPGFPVKITGIKATGSVMTAAWEPAADGRSGVVRVTPRSTDLPWNGSVVVLTDAGKDVVVFCRCIAPDVEPAPRETAP